MRAGTNGLPLHGGGEDLDDPSAYFTYRQGRMLNGVTTVSWALTDMAKGQGGFVVIPGSHKSNYPHPEAFDWRAPCVTHVRMRAGDVVIFTGAVAHGTYPWSAPHQRRSLLFKYAPGHLAFSPTYLERSPELAALLTPRQAALLEPPYVYHRPSVEPSKEQPVYRYTDPTATYGS
jgi:ectoine hydroxylase-related dioxygenase (phytanoyl-CoA dioxygenase family)